MSVVPGFGVRSAALIAVVCGAVCEAKAPPTTPPGITLVEVVRELGNSQPQFLWMRIGDAEGRTLFSYDKDDARNARCKNECAREFPPVLAHKGAKAFGDWTLVRQGRDRQWAYQGRPLYTWARETWPGEVANNLGLRQTANLKLAEGAAKPTDLLPPDGWQHVKFTPEASVPRPDVVDVKVVYRHQSVALVGIDGHTLYAFDGEPAADGQLCETHGCDIRWKPLAAPAIGTPIGDFTIVKRADGSPQWAWKKRPLYLYTGDLWPGDANGAAVDPRWSVAVLSENFRPTGVSVALFEGYGDALTIDGMTLYGGYAFGKRWGGRNLRDTFKDSYRKGKLLGGTACEEADCLAVWRPFVAPADARSGGFWEPITRADGTKQWAYKGYAMYTNTRDLVPGDHRGQAVYDFKKPEGSHEHIKKVAFFEQVGSAVAGAGIYWNIAKP